MPCNECQPLYRSMLAAMNAHIAAAEAMQRLANQTLAILRQRRDRVLSKAEHAHTEPLPETAPTFVPADSLDQESAPPDARSLPAVKPVTPYGI